MSGVSSMGMSFTGDKIAPAAVPARALQALLVPDRPGPDRLADRRRPMVSCWIWR